MRDNQRLEKLCKVLRKEASAVSLRKLCELDYSDQILMAQQLEAAINQILRIQTVADAKCSQVLELFEYMGGHVPTAADTLQERATKP